MIHTSYWFKSQFGNIADLQRCSSGRWRRSAQPWSPESVKVHSVSVQNANLEKYDILKHWRLCSGLDHHAYWYV